MTARSDAYRWIPRCVRSESLVRSNLHHGLVTLIEKPPAGLLFKYSRLAWRKVEPGRQRTRGRIAKDDCEEFAACAVDVSGSRQADCPKESDSHPPGEVCFSEVLPIRGEFLKARNRADISQATVPKERADKSTSSRSCRGPGLRCGDSRVGGGLGSALRSLKKGQFRVRWGTMRWTSVRVLHWLNWSSW